MLKDLGKPDATSISVEDATAITKAFTDTVLNGDGIVIPRVHLRCRSDEVHRGRYRALGGVTDRSGKPGLDEAKADELFEAVDARVGWLVKGRDPALLPLGAGTAAAACAVDGVARKARRLLTRCRVAAFDPRGATTLAGQDAELVALGSRTLSSEMRSSRASRSQGSDRRRACRCAWGSTGLVRAADPFVEQAGHPISAQRTY